MKGLNGDGVRPQFNLESDPISRLVSRVPLVRRIHLLDTLTFSDADRLDRPGPQR